MNIYLGTDHNGFHAKTKLAVYLKQRGHEIHDVGDSELNPDDDFPVFAAKVTHGVLSSKDKDPRGILLCGSGQGMCMAANRFKGIRAALGYDLESVRAARNDDDSNVLCVPVEFLDQKRIEQIVDTWLKTPFAGATRYKRRIRELDELS